MCLCRVFGNVSFPLHHGLSDACCRVCVCLSFALYDPVWFIIKPEWAAVILIVLLTASVERNFEKQLVLFVLGMCQGELVYSFVIQKLAGAMAVGGFQWLNACSAGMILLFGISKYEQLASQIGQKSKRSNKGATKMS